jgi:nicotinate-nucleotide adenylyltransferase
VSTSVSELLGIFGGTFDPVHVGHLRLAEEACEHLGLQQVLWIPAGQPRHREPPRVTAQHRLDMVRLATAGNPAFLVDGSEALSPQASYTVPTLERLRSAEGSQRPLVLLLGADAFAGLPTWHRWHELFALAHIAVSHRPGFPIGPASLPEALAVEFEQRRRADPAELHNTAAGSICTFAMTQLAVSATQIRALLANGKSARYLLPEAVIAYIQQHQLYSVT